MSDDTTAESRRAAALDAMRAAHPAVSERFARTHGLRLPRQLAVFAAFWTSLDARERAAMHLLGLQPWGITQLFLPGGLDLRPRDGLDERLDCRFRRDPPEFVTVLGGDSDGLHFGFWYDDPAELPTFVVLNYARDSAETCGGGMMTLLGQVWSRLDDRLRDGEDADDDAAALRALAAALDWFAPADGQALEEDGPRRWSGADRPETMGSIGPALPSGSGDPGSPAARTAAYRGEPDAVRRLVADARADLAAGRPAAALVVGSELHWLDRDDLAADALELLTGAYRALGRDALAGIAEVHHRHRDLRSVEVLQPV
jgi:hypothetical protein